MATPKAEISLLKRNAEMGERSFLKIMNDCFHPMQKHLRLETYIFMLSNKQLWNIYPI